MTGNTDGNHGHGHGHDHSRGPDAAVTHALRYIHSEATLRHTWDTPPRVISSIACKFPASLERTSPEGAEPEDESSLSITAKKEEKKPK